MIYVYDKNHLLQTEIPFSFVEESVIKESLETGALTYVLDGVYTEETKEKFDFIKNEKYIIVPNFEGSFYEFRIKDMLKDDYKLNVYAENSALELSSRFLLPQKQQLTIREWLTLSLDGERWRPGIVESTAIRTLTIDKPTSKLAFVNVIRKSVDLDIRFRIEMKGSKVDGRYIDLIKRGNDMGVEFEYGHDLVSVKRKVNTENIYTAAIGYGTSETATADGSQLFYFNNVEWKKSQGKPVDKPFGEYIVAIPEAFQKWNVDGRHLVYIHESDAKDSESLLQHTYEVLRRKIEQSITYDVDIVMLHRIAGYEHRKVKLGDTIAVRDKDLAWILQARILDLEQSHVNPRNDKVLIGRYREIQKENLDMKIKRMQEILGERLLALVIPIITSTAGNVFKNGIGSTELTANAFLSGLEYDADGTKYTYTWSKHDKTGNLVPSFIKTGKTITVNANEIDEKATYVVTVKNDKVSIPAEITITNVFDGADGKDGYTPIKGVDYFDGVDGQNGKDGSSSFLWIRYSQNADGSNMTTDPTGAKYIGVATSKTSTAPTSNADYQWSLIKGADGVKGEKGADGQTSYLHIKYSNDGGKTFTANNGETVGDWIGTYVDFTELDSTNVTDYTWNKVKGEQGPQGIPGPKGADGQSLYTWVKYADSPTSGMSDYPTNKKYIGLAYNKTTPVESTNYADYQWAKIEGDQGAPGAPGTTTYTWVKYADDDKGAGMSDSPVGKRYLGLAYNKTTQTESTNPADYSWSPLYDNVKVGGVNLASFHNWELFSGSWMKDIKTYSIILIVNPSNGSNGISQTVSSLNLEPNTEYVFSYKIRRLEGSLLRIGGHIDRAFEDGQYFKIDGSVYPSYMSPPIVQSLDDGNWHYVEYYFKTPLSIVGTDRIYIQVNRMNYTAPLKVEIKEIQIEKGNIATPWRPSIEDVEADAQAKANKAEQNANTYTNTVKTQLQKDIADVNNSVTTLDNYVDGAFKDGIISNAEATAIEKYLNTVNLEKTDLDGRYLQIYNNTDLTNTTIKTDLYNKKVAYNSAHTNLINSINTAIADGKTTSAEKQDVDSKFASYRTALANLTTAFEKALTSISQKQADTAKTTAINIASTDATNKMNEAETNIKTGLNNATIPVSGNSIATPIPATKLNIDINVQNGNPPFTSKNAMLLGSYICAMVPWTHNTVDFLLFRHNKRFLTVELYGFWAYETEGTPPVNGYCEYYLSNTQDVSGAIGGTYGTFTVKSDVVAGVNEQYKEITIDLGAPTNQIRKIFVIFATRGYGSDQSYKSYIRMGGRYLHD